MWPSLIGHGSSTPFPDRVVAPGQCTSGFTDDHPCFIHHAHARLVQRNINPSEILHNCLLLLLTGSPFLPASYRSDSVRGRRSRRDVASDYPICLAAYNSGYLHGTWIAATTPDGIMDAVRAMLAASPLPDAEEWAIHDHDGFEGAPLSDLTVRRRRGQGVP